MTTTTESKAKEIIIFRLIITTYDMNVGHFHDRFKSINCSVSLCALCAVDGDADALASIKS